jgi:tRNA(fMet)-specific endonuclease VapC
MTLELWLRHANTPGRYLQGYTAARQQLKVVSVDEAVAYRAARVGSFLPAGARMNLLDLLVAATALVHDMTLVTHTPQVYAQVPGLKLADWLIP